jgi:dihydropteroate synthase
MRVLEISSLRQLKQIMQDIGVDPCGIRIMLPKAVTHLVRLNSVSNIAANILKQEMLSLGADAALARGALTGRTKRTDCLLMGNLSQFQRLNAKLQCQPFGLRPLSQQLSRLLADYAKDDFSLNLGRFKLNLSQRPHIMGIVNITPDSFSGDGLYRQGQDNKDRIVAYVHKLIRDGADIIDIGGESTRPTAKPLPLKEELRRVIPAIKLLAKRIKVPISIDTYKARVARQALDCGACIVNDISGLRDLRMAGVVRRYKAAVVIMHMKGNPSNMQDNPRYHSLIDEMLEYLEGARDKALAAGISRKNIIIDPGIGFGKTLAHNLEILKRLKEFKVLGQPILIGTSRKSFLAKILDVSIDRRIFGTVASCVAAVKNGANIVRVHDVKEVKEALKVLTAIETA